MYHQPTTNHHQSVNPPIQVLHIANELECDAMKALLIKGVSAERKPLIGSQIESEFLIGSHIDSEFLIGSHIGSEFLIGSQTPSL